MIASASNPIFITRNTNVWDVHNPIYAIHALVTNTVPVEIWFPRQSNSITFPAGSFVAGAIYPYYVVKISWEDPIIDNDIAAAFIGLRLSNISK